MKNLALFAILFLLLAACTQRPAQEEVSQPEQLLSISLSELSSHNSEDDCWVAYEGKIYDITGFIPNHKDYRELIAPLCGTSDEFEEKFEGKHGKSKVEVLLEEGVYKGDLVQ